MAMQQGPPGGAGRQRVAIAPNANARARSARAQKTTPDQDSKFATKRSCEFHLIEYYSGPVARCPMCASDGVLEEVQQRALVLERENIQLRNQMHRLQIEVNLTSAIRQSITILDDNDYEWLKVQMYQYKLDKSVSLKPTHGSRDGKRIKRGEKMPANGFMTVPRRGDPEAHIATSIGGIAMAEYLEESINTGGIAQAMGTMLKAWSTVLPGGLE